MPVWVAGSYMMVRLNPDKGEDGEVGILKNNAILETSETATIDYNYDPLYRLTEANYSDGKYYLYAYRII